MAYTVRGGDSWSRIAKRIYGDSRMMGELMRANPDIFHLHPGQKLRIPKKKKDPYLSEQELFRQPYKGAAGYTKQGQVKTEGAEKLPGLEVHLSEVQQTLSQGGEGEGGTADQTDYDRLMQWGSTTASRQEARMGPEIDAALQQLRDVGVEEENVTVENFLYLQELLDENSPNPNREEDLYRFTRRLIPSLGEGEDIGTIPGFASGVVERAGERILDDEETSASALQRAYEWIRRGRREVNEEGELQRGEIDEDFGERIPDFLQGFAQERMENRIERELRQKEKQEEREDETFYVQRNGMSEAIYAGSASRNVGDWIINSALPVFDYIPQAVAQQEQQTARGRLGLSLMRVATSSVQTSFWYTLRQIENLVRRDDWYQRRQEEYRSTLGYRYYNTETGLPVSRRAIRETLDEQNLLEFAPREIKNVEYLKQAVEDVGIAWRELWSAPRESFGTNLWGDRPMTEEEQNSEVFQELLEYHKENWAAELSPVDFEGQENIRKGMSRLLTQFLLPGGNESSILNAVRREEGGFSPLARAREDFRVLQEQETERNIEQLREQAQYSLDQLEQTSTVTADQVTPEILSFRETAYELARASIREAIELELEKAEHDVLYSPLYAFTWSASPARREEYIEGLVDAELQQGSPLTMRQMRIMKDNFVDPIQEVAGQMFYDPLNYLSLEFISDPLKQGVKKAFSWLGGKYANVLGEIAEISAEQASPLARGLFRGLTAPLKIPHLFGSVAHTQALRSAITTGVNNFQGAILNITRNTQLAKVTGEVAESTFGDAFDAMVKVVRTASKKAAEEAGENIAEIRRAFPELPANFRLTHYKSISDLIEAVRMTDDIPKHAERLMASVQPDKWGGILDDIIQEMIASTAKPLVKEFTDAGWELADAQMEALRRATALVADQRIEVFRKFTQKIRFALQSAHMNPQTGLMRDSLIFKMFSEEAISSNKTLTTVINGINTLAGAFRQFWIESVLSANPRWVLRNMIDSTFRYIVMGDNPYDNVKTIFEQITYMTKNIPELAEEMAGEGIGTIGETMARNLVPEQQVAYRLISGQYEGIPTVVLPFLLMRDEFTRLYTEEGVRRPFKLLYKSWTGGLSDFNGAIEFSLRLKLMHKSFFETFEVLEEANLDRLIVRLKDEGMSDDAIELATMIHKRSGTDSEKFRQLVLSMRGEQEAGRTLYSVFMSEPVEKLLGSLSPSQRAAFVEPIQRQLDELIQQAATRGEAIVPVIENFFDATIELMKNDPIWVALEEAGNLRDFQIDLLRILDFNADDVGDMSQLVSKRVAEVFPESAEAVMELSIEDVESYRKALENITEGFGELLDAGSVARIKQHTLASLELVDDLGNAGEETKQAILRHIQSYEIGELGEKEFKEKVIAELATLYNNTENSAVADIVSTTKKMLTIPTIDAEEIRQLEVLREIQPTKKMAEQLGELSDDEFQEALRSGALVSESDRQQARDFYSRAREAGAEVEMRHGQLEEELTRLSQRADTMDVASQRQALEVQQEVGKYIRASAQLRSRVEKALRDTFVLHKTGFARAKSWDLYFGVQRAIYLRQQEAAEHLLKFMKTWSPDSNMSMAQIRSTLRKEVPSLHLGEFLQSVGIRPKITERPNEMGVMVHNLNGFVFSGNGNHMRQSTQYVVQNFMKKLLNVNELIHDPVLYLDMDWRNLHNVASHTVDDVLGKVKEAKQIASEARDRIVRGLIDPELPTSRIRMAGNEARESLARMFPDTEVGETELWISMMDGGESNDKLEQLLRGEITEADILQDGDNLTLATFARYTGKDIESMDLQQLGEAAQDGLEMFVTEAKDDPVTALTYELMLQPLDELDHTMVEAMRVEAEQLVSDLENVPQFDLNARQWWHQLKGNSHRSNAEHKELAQSALQHFLDGTVPEGQAELNMYKRLREYLADSMRSGSFASDGSLMRPPHPQFFRVAGNSDLADDLSRVWVKEFGLSDPDRMLARRLQLQDADLHTEYWRGFMESNPVLANFTQHIPDKYKETPEDLINYIDEWTANLIEGPEKDAYRQYTREIEKFYQSFNRHATLLGGMSENRIRLLTPYNINMQPKNWLQWLNSTGMSSQKRRLYEEILEQWKGDLIEQITRGNLRGGFMDEIQYKRFADIMLEEGVAGKNRAVELSLKGSGEDVVSELGHRIEGALPMTQRAMVNYSGYSQLDQAIRTIYPFWMFTKGSIPFWLDTVTTHPRLIAYYERYMSTSRRLAIQAGYTTTNGEVLPSAYGYMPIPGTDMWIDFSSPFSMRSIMPNRRMYWHETDNMTMIQKITTYLYDMGTFVGMSMPPWITRPMLGLGLLNENVVNKDGFIPLAQLIPSWQHYWIEEKLRQTQSQFLGNVYQSVVNPQQSWEDWMVEKELLGMALEWIDQDVPQEEVVRRVQEALGYTSDVRDYRDGQHYSQYYEIHPREDNEYWQEAMQRASQRESFTTLTGFFTGMYPKKFTDADAQIIKIRTDINMLRDTLNSEIGSMIFQLDPNIEERWQRYVDAKYEEPEGWISNTYGAMRWVRTPEGEIPDPAERRQIMAQRIHEEQVTQAFYEKKAELSAQLNAQLENLAIGAPSEQYWMVYKNYFDQVAQVESNPYYADAFRSTTSGYKPRELIKEEMRDLFFRLMRESIPSYADGESYDVYQATMQDWKDNFDVVASALAANFKSMVFDYIGGGRGINYEDYKDGVLENLHGEEIDVDAFVQEILDNADIEAYEEWDRSKDTVLDALNNAWKETYWNPYFEVLEGSVSREERELLRRQFMQEHSEPPTPLELAGWIMDNYPDRWTLEEIIEAATVADREIKSIDDRLEADNGIELLEQEVWTLLSHIPPGKMGDVLDHMQASRPGSEDDINTWYTTNGNAEAWDPEDFADFVEGLSIATQNLELESPSNQQLEEWAAAKALNDEFARYIANSLGENFLDDYGSYYNMSWDEKKNSPFREQVDTYKKLRDLWANNFQIWAKYYDPEHFGGGEPRQTTGEAVDMIGSSYFMPPGLAPRMGAELTTEVENLLEEGDPISDEGIDYLEHLAAGHPEWREFIDFILQIDS